MFGYVRPEKSELLIREYTRYRSIYCGLCKTIGHHYGQTARFFLSYDLTMLALLLLSLSDGDTIVSAEGCVLNPLRKKPVLKESPILDLCAGLSVLMIWHKAEDDKHDGRFLRGKTVQLAGIKAYRKARKLFPAYDKMICDSTAAMRKLEETPVVLDLTASAEQAAEKSEKLAKDAAALFGRLLHDIFMKAAETCLTPQKNIEEQSKVIQAAGLLGFDLGSWIYVLDAIDDYQTDSDNNQWNPLAGCSYHEAVVIAGKVMEDHELKIDRTAALLPYCRDSGLIANIVLQGLVYTRKTVLRGEKLKRI